MMNVDELMSEAESLPIEIKTQLIDRLLNSINATDEEVDKLWAIEAEKRVAEVRSGKVKTIPGDQVFKEVFDKYSR